MRAGYGQYCPVARGAEVFAERWTPLVIRNIFVNCHSFKDILEGVPRMSRNLLAQRLRSLEQNGIVERRPNPAGRGWLYHLTPAGEELIKVNIELGCPAPSQRSASSTRASTRTSWSQPIAGP